MITFLSGLKASRFLNYNTVVLCLLGGLAGQTAVLSLRYQHVAASCILVITIFTIWAYLEDRKVASLFIIFFYFTITQWILNKPSFGFIIHYKFHFIIWLINAIILTLPWFFLHPKQKKTITILFTATLALILLTNIPPFCVVNNISFLAIAGYLFPGMHWFGLASTIFLYLTIMLLVRTKSKISLLCLTGLICISCYANITFNHVNKPAKWAEINLSRKNNYGKRLVKKIKQLVLSGIKVVVFPENFFDPWSHTKKMQFNKTISLIKQNNMTLISGSSKFNLGLKEKTYGFLVISNINEKFYSSRLPMPVSLWNPFNKNSTPINLLKHNYININNKRVLVNVCYENSIPWFTLLPFAINGKADIILAISKTSWGPAYLDSAVHFPVKSIARLFNVPLIISNH